VLGDEWSKDLFDDLTLKNKAYRFSKEIIDDKRCRG
jgi:hypothetical protein